MRLKRRPGTLTGGLLEALEVGLADLETRRGEPVPESARALVRALLDLDRPMAVEGLFDGLPGTVPG